MNTHKIHISIQEDGQELDTIDITYHEGQDYRVWLTTPDGADASIHRQAGHQTTTHKQKANA